MLNSQGFVLDPRLENDSTWVCDLALSQLRIINDSQFKWFILVPRKNGLREIIDLTEVEQIDLLQESAKLSKVLQDLYQPHKLNIAAIGNVVAQLHLHHICRYEHDVAWPSPVWGKQAMRPYNDDEKQAIILQVRAALFY
ncbi:HIT domain-containing protein [Glaciecola sp. MH2013]|uniref:HIT domain-containing protein n=1 Tax=Glaciecola sp. MH2013 TaxID=2785524 RepID=UPI0018A0FF3C|nr:HIT domain-containing protein [Glaciecola sp. MH2013]MBF7072985.1 HIT domain-containing protein [Glaciecola sp. MH2013]